MCKTSAWYESQKGAFSIKCGMRISLHCVYRTIAQQNAFLPPSRASFLFFYFTEYCTWIISQSTRLYIWKTIKISPLFLLLLWYVNCKNILYIRKYYVDTYRLQSISKTRSYYRWKMVERSYFHHISTNIQFKYSVDIMHFHK